MGLTEASPFLTKAELTRKSKKWSSHLIRGKVLVRRPHRKLIRLTRSRQKLKSRMTKISGTRLLREVMGKEDSVELLIETVNGQKNTFIHILTGFC